MSDVAILGPDAKPLPEATRKAARLQMAKARMMASAAYQGAGNDHPSLAKWRPGTWSGQSALSWNRVDLVDRLNDVARNDGWGAAGTSRLVDNIIGSGWTLAARPNHISLNIRRYLRQARGTVARLHAGRRQMVRRRAHQDDGRDPRPRCPPPVRS
jgi:capsid protein